MLNLVVSLLSIRNYPNYTLGKPLEIPATGTSFTLYPTVYFKACIKNHTSTMSTVTNV